jgi:hypothetical protein
MPWRFDHIRLECDPYEVGDIKLHVLRHRPSELLDGPPAIDLSSQQSLFGPQLSRYMRPAPFPVPV